MMMRLQLVLYVIAVFINFDGIMGKEPSKVTKNVEVSGYYWRDYTGNVPSDALPGGLDKKRATTYIGQVLHGDALILGEIQAAEKKISYELFQMEYTSIQNVKILCAPRKEEFEWIKISNNKSREVGCLNAVEGGYEAGNVVYVGRVAAVGEKVIGKVCVDEKIATLRISPHAGREFKYTSFEVLRYDPKASAKSDNKVCTAAKSEPPLKADIPLLPVQPERSSTDTRIINLDIKVSGNKLVTAVATVCIMQYLVIAIFSSVIYILICLISRNR